ncbi:MAG TPA: glycosyltransferase family 2 protein [bacterium]|nr:glycosyltransferase family 2 protein [bacterium]
MKVSILIPTFQEGRYITRCLNSIITNEYDFVGTGSEILVIDGHSTDGTRDIVTGFMERHPFVRMIDNPDIAQVVGLNVGFKVAIGDIIIRCDAHSEYPRNYVRELVAWHAKGLAANIGGCWVTLPGDESIRAQAIAEVMRHPVGVGLTYRTAPEGKERFVDTVPFGSWKRETIDAFGPFDEEFIRAQDLEHNMRLRARGEKILMLPWLRIRYYARESYDKAASMFYQYGYWKNKVNRKFGTICSIRQLIPPLFVLGLIALAISACCSTVAAALFLAYIGLYVIPILAFSMLIIFQQPPERRSFGFFLLVAIAFFMTHFSYGFGYIMGFINIIILRRADLGKNLKTHTR